MAALLCCTGPCDCVVCECACPVALRDLLWLCFPVLRVWCSGCGWRFRVYVFCGCQ